MFPVWGLVNPKAFHKYYTHCFYYCVCHYNNILFAIISFIYIYIIIYINIYIYIHICSIYVHKRMCILLYIYTYTVYLYWYIYIYILHIRFQRNAASGKNRATGLEPYGGASLENSNYAVLQFGHGHLVNLADLAVRPPLISDCPWFLGAYHLVMENQS